MKALREYAEKLERSGGKRDLIIARYIRTHEARLGTWMETFCRGRGGLRKADREELLQVTLLAIVEAVQAPSPEAAITEVRNAMDRFTHQANQWRIRRNLSPKREEGNEI